MEICVKLNGRDVRAEVGADLLLLDFVRAHGCLSVKRGCETSACGLCTVLLDGEPVLSCSTLVARANGHSVHTLELLFNWRCSSPPEIKPARIGQGRRPRDARSRSRGARQA